VVNHEPDLAGLPARLRDLVARCLAKDPAARPTAAGLLAELGGGQLAANWLPDQVTATLGRYVPPAQAPEWPSTADRPLPGVPAPVPVRGAAGLAPAGATAPGRGRRAGWRHPGWLTAAAAAAVALAATVTGLALGGPGHPGHAVAEPSAHPVAALRTDGAARAPRKAAATAPRGAKAPAKPHSRTAPGRSAPAVSAVTAAGPAGPAPSRAPRPAHSSPPPSTAVVPGVLGTTLPAASSALRARGFSNIPYVYDCYGSAGAGDVVRQAPGAGATIALTAPVQLYLQANNCATVPDVIGMNLSNAAYTLKQEGFTNIPYLYGCYGSARTGAVVSQAPGAGTSYGTNQPVSLRLQASNC
jgi:serine/threonine-protein kinase